jgi:hypothetical protein
MSIGTMMRLGYSRENEKVSVAARAAAGGPAAGDSKAIDSAMQKVAAFIPSEVIGAYVAGVGILSPDGSAGKWWLFAICLVLVPVFVALGALIQQKDASSAVTKRQLVRLIVILVVLGGTSFVAYASALPGSPFLEINDQATRVGGIAVILLAGLMYKLADLLDVVPKAN